MALCRATLSGGDSGGGASARTCRWYAPSRFCTIHSAGAEQCKVTHAPRVDDRSLAQALQSHEQGQQRPFAVRALDGVVHARRCPRGDSRRVRHPIRFPFRSPRANAMSLTSSVHLGVRQCPSPPPPRRLCPRRPPPMWTRSPARRSQHFKDQGRPTTQIRLARRRNQVCRAALSCGDSGGEGGAQNVATMALMLHGIQWQSWPSRRSFCSSLCASRSAHEKKK